MNSYNNDQIWLSPIYTSVEPIVDDHGRLLWMAMDEQTPVDTCEYTCSKYYKDMKLNAEVIDGWIQNQDSKKTKTVIEILSFRLRKGVDTSVFKKLNQRLEEVCFKAEQGLIGSVDINKQVCAIAR